MDTSSKPIYINGTPSQLLETLHNDTQGPAARIVAFREGIRAAMDAIGIKYKTSTYMHRITIE